MNYADHTDHPYLLAYYSHLLAFVAGLFIGSVVL